MHLLHQVTRGVGAHGDCLKYRHGIMYRIHAAHAPFVIEHCTSLLGGFDVVFSGFIYIDTRTGWWRRALLRDGGALLQSRESPISLEGLGIPPIKQDGGVLYLDAATGDPSPVTRHPAVISFFFHHPSLLEWGQSSIPACSHSGFCEFSWFPCMYHAYTYPHGQLTGRTSAVKSVLGSWCQTCGLQGLGYESSHSCTHTLSLHVGDHSPTV